MNINPQFTSPYLLGVNKESQEKHEKQSTISTKTIDSAAASEESHHPDLIPNTRPAPLREEHDWDSLAEQIAAITNSIPVPARTPRDKPGEVLIEEVLTDKEFPSPAP